MKYTAPITRVDTARQCQCHDAQRWRAYWTAEEIGRRLAEELLPYQLAWKAAENAVANDLRGYRRIYLSADWTQADMVESRARAAFPGCGWDR